MAKDGSSDVKKLPVDEDIHNLGWSKVELEVSDSLLILQQRFVIIPKPTDATSDELPSTSRRPRKGKRSDDFSRPKEPKPAEHLTVGGGVSSHTNSITPERHAVSITRDMTKPCSFRVKLSSHSQNLVRDETRPYKCDKCTESFSTPQQLGGHKIVHRVKQTKAPADSASSLRLTQTQAAVASSSSNEGDQAPQSSTQRSEKRGRRSVKPKLLQLFK